MIKDNFGQFGQFSIKTYIMGTHYNRLIEAILMSTHYVCFYGEITEITLKYPSYLFH